MSVELIDAAQRLEDGVVFVQPVTRKQHRRATVSRLRVNLEALRHRAPLK